MPRRTYATLDGMRGLAAVLVVTRHSQVWFGHFMGSTHLAVDLFFVLSGFVLAHAYGEKLDGGMSPWRFMVVRLIRLYPLFLLGLALGIGAEALSLARGHAMLTGRQIIEAAALGVVMLPMLGAPFQAL